ncbi:hypothetical protein HK099_005616 [Clydaea vesicula]|uniref:Multidrug and toxic compound extrusion protein n=1 Tax=Clydaea vesicula TaxID=447962 RepID=A0AAD5TYX2_9FUNG|nr:hypothetical protein HK099_005616 [Clydaea vesicula]
MAWPVSFGYFLQNSLLLATVFSMGHVGTKELAACALATMWANVSGFSLGIGMASSLDTLCSHSHTGSLDIYANGKHLQRALVVMSVISVMVSALWCFTEDLLLLAGQDAEVSRLAGIYIYYLIPSVFPYFAFECLKRYLQSQGIMSGALFCIFLGSPLNAILQYLLVWGPLNLGFIGAPLGLSITYIILPCFMVIYIRYFTKNSAWGGWDFAEAFNVFEIMELLKLGIPGVFMICTEWWAFEVIALIAGWFGEKSLAAQSIVLTTTSLAYMIPMGISIAASTRIGNALGAHCADMAKISSFSSLLLGGVIGTLSCTFFLVVKDSWGYLWTSDIEVVTLVAQILPVASVYQLSDSIAVIGAGVLRGCGHQKIGAIINLCGYYILGIPVGLLFAFTFAWKVTGLFVGVAVGLIAVSIFYACWVLKLNFEQECENLRLKLKKTNNYLVLENDEEYYNEYQACE